MKQFEQFHDCPPLPDLLPKKSGSPRGLFNARGAYWKKIRAPLFPFSFASKMKMVNIHKKNDMHCALIYNYGKTCECVHVFMSVPLIILLTQMTPLVVDRCNTLESILAEYANSDKSIYRYV